MSETISVLIPKQMALLKLIERNDVSWIGYGGARGGAKSHAIRELALYFGINKEYKLKSLIFRRVSGELLKNHINPLFKFHPSLRKQYNKSEKILYDKSGNPMIQFGYADSDDDIHTFQGSEYDLIFIDEATRCSEYQINFLRTCNRTTAKNWKPKMVLTMNPGGISHSYLHRLFIYKKYNENEDEKEYAYLHSAVWDNVFWSFPAMLRQGITIEDYYEKWNDSRRREFCLQNSDYAKNLNSLSADLREAYLYGNWNVFGGMFFKDFNIAKHVMAPFVIPDGWDIIGSIDPGFSSPCSFGITAIDFEGVHYRIWTYYEKERSAGEHAKQINDVLSNPEHTVYKVLKGRKPRMIVSGRDAFAHKDRYSVLASEKTFADVFAEHGLFLTPATTDRKLGWWAWKGLFPNNYYIFSELNNDLIDEMMSAVSDPKDPEDMPGKGNNKSIADHALDEQRYAIMSLYCKREIKAAHKKISRLNDDIEYNEGVVF